MRRTVPASRVGRSGSLRPPAALPPVLHVTRSARSVRPGSCLRGGIRDEPTRPAASWCRRLGLGPAGENARPEQTGRGRAAARRREPVLGLAPAPVGRHSRVASVCQSARCWRGRVGGGACWGRESHAPAHHEAGPGRALGLPGPQEPARLVCTRGQGQGAFGAAEVRGRAGPRGLGVPGRSRGLGGGPGTVVSSGVAPACPDPARAAARHPGTPSARRLAQEAVSQAEGRRVWPGGCA